MVLEIPIHTRPEAEGDGGASYGETETENTRSFCSEKNRDLIQPEKGLTETEETRQKDPS